MEKRRIEEIRGSAAKAKGVWIGKGIETIHSKDKSRGPPLVVTKGNERRNRGILGEGRAEWEMAATSLHDDALLNSEECHE